MRPLCHSTVLAGSLSLLAPLLMPSVASACGGLFCSGGPAPVPVEQNAERILFEVNPNNTISSTVEISYTGDPLDFAWVVPVPSTPELEIVPAQVLTLLDDGTAPLLTGQPTRCGLTDRGCATGGEFSSTRRLSSLVEPVLAAPLAILGCTDAAYYDNDSFYDPVNVEDFDRVGPFEPTVVSSDDPAALIDWLNAEGYFIAESMEPYIAEYVAGGSKFLAMKLAPDAGVSDIAPIRMTYEGTVPQIPIVLTAIAAEPEMAIVTFIAADSRYHSGNYANLLMDPAWLRFDPSSTATNYYAVASWLADSVGGSAFFTEYAGPVNVNSFGFEEAEDWVMELGSRHSTLTRMFTRLSGWEMTEDPYFESTDAGTIPSGIDLSANQPVNVCGEDAPLGQCGGSYCGPGALCASTELGPACLCPEGWAARQVSAVGAAAGGGIPEVTCQRLDHVLFTGEDLDPNAGGACLPGMCGDGECVDLNGFPTCLCGDGLAAAVGVDGAPVCTGVIDTFGPEEALVGGDMGSGFASTEPTAKLRRGEVLIGALILMLPGVLRSRRRSA